MSVFSQFVSRTGKSAEEIREILQIPLDRFSGYLSGIAEPTGREIRVLKGLAAIEKQAGNDISRHESENRFKTLQSQKVEATMKTSAAKKPRKKTKGRSTSGLTTLELCAGGGGAALGLELAKFRPVALIEYDQHACATLRHNRRYWNVIEADIRRFDASYWKGVDLLSGGLPCPPFSIAGKQLGADDDRDLFPAMLRIVKEAQPRGILIENVRGILTERFKPFRSRVDTALGKEGFDTYWTAFNAKHFGVPQERFRVFLVALRRGYTKPLKWPIAMPNLPTTVGQAIGDIMSAQGWRGAEQWIKLANAPAPTIVGGSHKHGGPDLGPTRARKEWAQLGVDGLGLADAPPARDFQGNPRLTIPMVARLQSFPDDWEFVGGKTHMYRQVGNALPVKLAYSVASAVRVCLS